MRAAVLEQPGLPVSIVLDSGRVNGECHRRHRSVELRAFLDSIGASVPADLEVHLILAALARSSRPASGA
jgi:hypothetical protein